MKVPEGGKAPEVLAGLQQVMSGHPPPWLAKILGVPPEQRTKFTAQDTDAAESEAMEND